MTADAFSLPEGWEERFDDTRNRKYWLWTLSNPPQKSYRHPLGDTTQSTSNRSTRTNFVGTASSSSSSPMQDSSVPNDDDETANDPSPGAASDAPAYTELSGDASNMDHSELPAFQEYQEIISPPTSIYTFTDSPEPSEISPPVPRATEFQASAMRQRLFATSTASDPRVLLSSPPRSRRTRSASTLGLNGPRYLPGNTASNVEREIASVSQPTPSSAPTAIPTISVKYRSGLFDSKSSASANPSSTGVPNLYTQVQYHGPQVPQQNGNVDMPFPHTHPTQVKQEPPPPMMWRTGHPQVSNPATGSFGQGQPQFPVQVPAHPVTPNDPSGTFIGNGAHGAHMSTPLQPVTLGAMPGPGQPGYAGYTPPPPPPPSFKLPPSPGMPLQNQGQFQGQMTAQIQMQVQEQLQTNQQISPQQSSQQPNVHTSSSQLGPPPPPPPPPPQQQQQQQGRLLYSPPSFGGIIPAPYEHSSSSSRNRPRNSGMPPHSKPLPGKFAPPSYKATQAQLAGAGRPPLQQQQGAQVQVQVQVQAPHPPQQQVSSTGFSTQPGPPPGVHSTVQAHQVQQANVPWQTRPASGNYVPVPFSNAPQIQHQHQHQPIQQVSMPMHSSPPPRPTSHNSLQPSQHTPPMTTPPSQIFQQPQVVNHPPTQSPPQQHAQNLSPGLNQQILHPANANFQQTMSASVHHTAQAGLSQPSTAHPTLTHSPSSQFHASSPSPQFASFSPNLQSTPPQLSPTQFHSESQATQAQMQQGQIQGLMPTQHVPMSYGAMVTVPGTVDPAQQSPLFHANQPSVNPGQGVNSANPPVIPQFFHQPSQVPHGHSHPGPHVKPSQPGRHHHHHRLHSQHTHPQQLPDITQHRPHVSQPQHQQQYISSSSSSTVSATISTPGIPPSQHAQQVPYSSVPLSVPMLPTTTQPTLQQNASSVPYNSNVYPNHAMGNGQNILPQAVQQNMSQYQAQSAPQTNPPPQSQPQQGSGPQGQLGGGNKFTLSNITDAINLGVSAINLYENVDNAINPGSYPNASSNSGGGGGGVVVNINTGGQAQGGGNGGNNQNSNSNVPGGSRLSDANNFLTALNGAVSAFSSLNIGGGDTAGGNNSQNNGGGSSGGLNTGLDYNPASNGYGNDNMAAMNFGLGSDGVSFGGGDYGLGTNFGSNNFGSGVF